MYKAMKIKKLKNYGIPSYVLDIWEEHYSPYLQPLQEEAVRNYGILNCGKESYEIAALSSKARNDNNNLLVIAPPSSGKTFIGEMAAIAQAIHQKKIIYLVPFRSLVEEKYRHFKDLYSNCGIDISISKRLIEGVEEEGLNLIRLYVPGLNRYYINKLLKEGYKDENCLKELSKKQLSKVLPKRLVNRVQKRFALVLSSSSTKNYKPKTCNLPPTSCNLHLVPCNSDPHTLNTND